MNLYNIHISYSVKIGMCTRYNFMW